MVYFATIYRETSATKMPEYTELGSFNMKNCKESQIAKKQKIEMNQIAKN